MEGFESNWIKCQQLRWAVRKDEFEPIKIQSEVPTCSLFGRLSLFRAGLVSHLRKHKDTVPNATSTHVCLQCGRFF